MKQLTEDDLIKMASTAFSPIYQMQAQCLLCPRGWLTDCMAACEVTGLHDREETKWTYEDKCEGRGIFK